MIILKSEKDRNYAKFVKFYENVETNCTKVSDEFCLWKVMNCERVF